MVSEAPTIPALQARLYGEKLGDYQVVSGWWEARRGQPLPEVLLPPIGVIVEGDGVPVAALWCYQSVGIGVCFLEFLCTPPQLCPKSARRAIKMAVDACVMIAKAQGDYAYFRCIAEPLLAREVAKLGFAVEAEGFTQLAFRQDG